MGCVIGGMFATAHFRFPMVTGQFITSQMTSTTGLSTALCLSVYLNLITSCEGSTTPGNGLAGRERGMGPPASGTGPSTPGSTGELDGWRIGASKVHLRSYSVGR